MIWKDYDQFIEHTLGFHKIFMERKFVDVSDHPTIAINIHRTTAKCQCLTANLSKAGTEVGGEISLQSTDKDRGMSR